MRYKNTKNKGFTFIELLLYISMFTFVILSISIFLSTISFSNTKNQTIMEVENQGRFIMEHIKKSIRNSEAITSPGSGGTSTSLTLDVYDAPSDPTIYDVLGGNIRITEGITSPEELNNDRVEVSNMSFQNLSRADTPGIVRIEFTLTHTNTSGRNEYDWSKVFWGTASVRQP
jgi:type II secretory pathway component PulJ